MKKSRKIIKLSKSVLLFIMVCSCVFSCRSSVTYYDESRKPPIPLKYYRSQAPVRYDRFYSPSSRAYQNPYSGAPRNYYPYYDMDHYYVPPAGFNPYDRDDEFKGGKFDINNIM